MQLIVYIHYVVLFISIYCYCAKQAVMNLDIIKKRFKTEIINYQKSNLPTFEIMVRALVSHQTTSLHR